MTLRLPSAQTGYDQRDENELRRSLELELARVTDELLALRGVTTAVSAVTVTAAAQPAITSVGTLTGLTVTAPIAGSVTGSSGSTTGNAATATVLQTTRAINGVNFNGSAPITVTADASTLSGVALAAAVVGSSLTSLGTLVSLAVTGAITAASATVTGILKGRSGVLTNGNSVGVVTLAQLKFGLGGVEDYPSFIHTEHDAGTASKMMFYVGDGTQAGVFPTNAVLGLTVTQGTITSPLVQTVASATAKAGFNIPHGTAPTSPVNGDMWSTTAGLFIRINGVTKTVTLT